MHLPATGNYRSILIIQILSGIVLFAVGLAALIGWHTGDLMLAGALENYPPMHYVTAVSFVVCAIGVLFAPFRSKILTIIPGVILILIGIVDFTEYLLEKPFNIASVFTHQQFTGNEFHSTTIATVSFTFIGLAWIIRSLRWKYRLIVSGAMGTFALACGIGTLLGFVAGYPDVLRWGNEFELSISTGFAFAIIGALTILESRTASTQGSLSWSHYIPVGVLIFGLIVSFGIRQALHLQEIRMIDRTVELQLTNLSLTFESEMQRRIVANERMAKRWNNTAEVDKESWERDALGYHKDFQTFQAIEYVGADSKIRWVVPHESNENVIGFDLSNEETRRKALLEARYSRKTKISGSVSLVQGGIGMVSYSPIYNGNKFEGFIVGVFRVDKFFDLSIQENVRKNYSVAIVDRGKLIYSTDKTFEESRSNMDQTNTINFGGNQFVVKLRPTPQQLNELSSRNESLAILVGAIISILLSWALLLAFRARRHNNVTENSNKLLKTEIEGRKRIEKKLRETSTFREAILNGAEYVIISTDRNGVVTSFNKTAEYLLGYSSDEVIGKFSLDHFHDKSQIEEYGEELSRRFGYKDLRGFEPLVIRARDHVSDEREWRYMCKDGSSFPVSLSVTSIVDENGKVTGFLGIGRDNSQLHIASRLLVESEERFKAFVNNTPALTYIKDKLGRYRFVNSNFEKLFSIPPGSLIGKSDFSVTDEESSDEIAEIEKRVLETGLPEESVEIINLSNGSTAHFLFVRFVLPMPGGEDCLGVIGIDLSAQKAIEEELRNASFAAVESSRMKSEFLANMSHEIRTPMNGVLGMLEVLLDTPLNSSQREYASVIQDSAKSLLTILDDILDFSKLEAGKLTFETIEFDLRSTSENTIALFAEQCESRNIEITSFIHPDVPIELLGDPGRVRQVLTNLIGNGVKFTENGEVKLEISKVTGSDSRISLKFEITDTGIGIAENVQRSLFDAFVQADGSMVRKYGGTGLGLSISKQLVEMMNGEIGVESIPGEGSTFRFTATFGVQETVKPFLPAIDLSGRKILITDDHVANRESISNQLRALGMITVAVPDGESCIRELSRHADDKEPFDVLILDFEMPGMNGLETAELIKNIPDITETKIILMPTHGHRGQANLANQTGISAYLTKPVRQVELYDCVTTILGGSKVNQSEQDISQGTSGIITRHSLLENRIEHGTPILIVANVVKNQNLISMQLELLGYRSEIVSDRTEAFAAVKKREYSLIFLDLDNKSENAFTTAGSVRRVLNTDIPMIGITSDPSNQEREKAIAAGMNEYLSLPFAESQLRDTVAEFLDGRKQLNGRSQAGESTPNQNGDKELAMYLQQLLEEIGPDMVAMTFSLFAEDAGRHMTQIKAASDLNNIADVCEFADALAIVCDDVHASNMRELCLTLVEATKKADTQAIARSVGILQSGYEAVIEQLETFDLNTAATV